MKNNVYRMFFSLVIICFLITNGQTQEKQKLAQSGFQFLSVVSDARAAGMGEAMTSMQFASSALFFNPAGMSELEGIIDISTSVNQWIADINHYTFGIATKPFGDEYGVFGASVQSVEYGDFYGTRVSVTNPLGYEDTEKFSLSAMAIGIGYALQLTEKFSVGAQVRWVHQDLGESIIPIIRTGVDTTAKTVDNTLSPLVFDFGTIYRTGLKSLAFGMSVRNFSKEVKYVEEGFQAPLVFTIGISMNMMDFVENMYPDHKLNLSMDASHFRSHPEQIKIGLDYIFRDLLSLRMGYISNNFESNFTYGIGVALSGFAVDYAYTPFGVFNHVQRLTARFSL